MSLMVDRARWQEQLRPGSVRELFEYLPNLLYFLKDRELCLMGGNRAFVERCGFASEEEIIGLSDREIFPVELAEKYFQDDLIVLEQGKHLTGIVEVFPGKMGDPEWFVTDKVPLFDRSGEVAGLCGVIRSYKGVQSEISPYLELLPATEFIKSNYADKIRMGELAQRVGLSVRQFERKFKKAFKTTPTQYLLKFRILKTCELLVDSDLNVTEIAQQVGFFDHSALSKQFSAMIGVSPRAYRLRWTK
ncbi:MAG: helix-turn-helix domain-containing protein [Akkermansiaceae bacterium]